MKEQWDMTIKVLLVDDSQLAQKFTVFILKNCHCEIDTASDAREALSLLEQEKYDIIFVDYGLPDIKGPELAKKMRAIKGCETLPIIALSAHDPQVNEVDYELECLNAGMNLYITKPLYEERAYELFKTYIPDKIS